MALINEMNCAFAARRNVRSGVMEPLSGAHVCASYSPEDEELEVLEELDDESDDFDDSAGFVDSDEDDEPESDEPPAMLPDLPLSVL